MLNEIECTGRFIAHGVLAEGLSALMETWRSKRLTPTYGLPESQAGKYSLVRHHSPHMLLSLKSVLREEGGASK